MYRVKRDKNRSVIHVPPHGLRRTLAIYLGKVDSTVDYQHFTDHSCVKVAYNSSQPSIFC